MVFHGSWLVFMVFEGNFMVCHSFWFVSKVVSWFFTVLVFMVFKLGWLWLRGRDHDDHDGNDVNDGALLQ